MCFECSMLAKVLHNSIINITSISEFINHANFKKESFQRTVPRYGFNQAMNRSSRKTQFHIIKPAFLNQNNMSALGKKSWFSCSNFIYDFPTQLPLFLNKFIQIVPFIHLSFLFYIQAQ